MKRKKTQSVATTMRRKSLAATKMLRSKKNLVAIQKAKKSIVAVRQKACKNKRAAAVTHIKKNTPVVADIMRKVI